MSEITTIGLDLAKNVFQLHGPISLERLFCARSCGAIKFWPFSQRSHLVLSPWKLVVARTSGGVR